MRDEGRTTKELVERFGFILTASYNEACLHFFNLYIYQNLIPSL